MKIKNGNNEPIRADQKKTDEKGRAKADKGGKGKDFAKLLEADKKKPAKDAAGREPLGERSQLADPDSANSKDPSKLEQPIKELAAEKLFSKELDADRTMLAQKDAAVTQQRRDDLKAQVESGARIASDGTRDDQPIKQADDSPIQPIDGSAKQQIGVAEANSKAPAQPAKPDELQELISKMVQKIQVGEDARLRKTVILQVEIPDRGEVNIRLRKDGDGYDLRLRAKDPSFAHALRSEQGELRRMASEKGLRFTRIDVVQ